MESNKTNYGPFNIFAEAETTVEFFDLDPMNIVWHGNYTNYFEMSRHLLLEKMKFDYNEMKKSGYAFPVVDIHIKYKKSLLFRDKIKIRAVLMEYETCLKIKYEIIKTQTGEIAAIGSTTQMAIDVEKEESCFVSPAVLIERVEAFIKRKKDNE